MVSVLVSPATLTIMAAAAPSGPRTLALASLLSSLSSLQDSRDFSSPRKDLVLGRDGGIGT